MTHVTDPLPNDLQTLKALVSAQRAEIERLKMMIAKLRRTQFGRSSEQLDAMIDQLQLSLEELEVSQAEVMPITEPAPRTVPAVNHCLNVSPAKSMSINPSRDAPVVVGHFVSWGRMCLRCWSTFRHVSR
jgi:uncharacterized coiled-coil protein SlyX